MDRFSFQKVKEYLENASQENIEDILNARDGKERPTLYADFLSLVLKEEVIKGKRVKSTVLLYPQFYNRRNEDNVVLAEIHARKDTTGNYDEEYAHYTYAKVKKIEKASQSSNKEFEETIEAITNADIEVMEFRKSLKKSHFVDYLFIHDSIDEFVVPLSRMTYLMAVLDENPAKELATDNEDKLLVFPLYFYPIDYFSHELLEGFNSYYVAVEVMVRLDRGTIYVGKYRVLEVEDAESPTCEDYWDKMKEVIKKYKP